MPMFHKRITVPIVVSGAIAGERGPAEGKRGLQNGGLGRGMAKKVFGIKANQATFQTTHKWGISSVGRALQWH